MKTHYTTRHTGWQLAYGLRTDLYPSGYEFQSALGSLDAPTSMSAGATCGVKTFSASAVRFVDSTCFFRAD